MHIELFPDADPGMRDYIEAGGGGTTFHTPSYPERWEDVPKPSTRAALVLATVGIDWRREARL